MLLTLLAGILIGVGLTMLCGVIAFRTYKHRLEQRGTQELERLQQLFTQDPTGPADLLGELQRALEEETTR